MPDLVKLNHNQYAADIRAYLDAKAVKKKADADSRKADGVIKTLRSVIFLAMKDAIMAKCGNAVIVVKPEKRNAGALTLKDGRSIPLDTITDIVINGGTDVIKASDVKTWYGGALIGADLEITLTGDAV